ncbi:Amino-acid acetyltransferase, mitochondrial [Nowakowskiella sp. JEL0407]|nr:Amino-acid acetyltransferase, mitochondrial [Nowakowskiella sp. JEL0407]
MWPLSLVLILVPAGVHVLIFTLHGSLIALSLVGAVLVLFVAVCLSKPGSVKDIHTPLLPSSTTSYCSTCASLRPPLSYHCSQCNVCILLLDHHCVWLNNCIGANNYALFLSLILSIVIADGYMLYRFISELVLGEWRYGVLAIAIYCGFFFLSFSSVIVQHLWLVSRGLTTREYVRGVIFSERKAKSPNPPNSSNSTQQPIMVTKYGEGEGEGFFGKLGSNIILQILNTFPSQREARTFIRRVLISPSSTPLSVHYRDAQPWNPKQMIPPQSIKIREDYPGTARDITQSKSAKPSHTVSKRTIHIGLFIIDVGCVKSDGDLEVLASGIVRLERLGLIPVIYLSPDTEDTITTESIEKLRKFGVDLQTMLEKFGSRCLLLHSPSFSTTNSTDSNTPNDSFIKFDVKGLQCAIEMDQVLVVLPYLAETGKVIVEGDRTVLAIAEGIRDFQFGDNDTGEGGDDFFNPLKVIWVNDLGGIRLDVSKPCIPFINLGQEFDTLRTKLESITGTTPPTLETPVIPEESSKTMETIPKQIRQLIQAYTLLSKLSKKCSAVVCGIKDTELLVSNLITDKPTRGITVLRHGVSLSFFSSLRGTEKSSDQKLDLQKLKRLLESSFGKELLDGYWDRIDGKILSVIVAGDYDGAAIITEEGESGVEKVVYLDKFAVDPRCQGTGVADIIWGEVEKFKDLMWRSRMDNPVNKWYFDRSLGQIAGEKWRIFWRGEGVGGLKEKIKVIKSTASKGAETAESTNMIQSVPASSNFKYWARLIPFSDLTKRKTS